MPKSWRKGTVQTNTRVQKSPLSCSTSIHLYVMLPANIHVEQVSLYPFHSSSHDGTSERHDTVFLRSPFTSGPSGRLATSMAMA